MFQWPRRQLSVVIAVLLCSLWMGTAVFGQNLSVDQWVNLLGTENQQAFDYFVGLGPDAVPILQQAMETKWMFHAYIPQRHQVVKVMAAIDDRSTLPVLKMALTYESAIRETAIDAVLAIPGLTIGELFAELLTEQVDYQTAQLEILCKLYHDRQDVVPVLDEMFEFLASSSLDAGTIDKAADLIARFVIDDKVVTSTPQPLTREMILKALMEQQQAKEKAEEKPEPVDINPAIFDFLTEQLDHADTGNRVLALRTIGRLADLVRGLELNQEIDLTSFVQHLLPILGVPGTDMRCRILAAKALELITPHDQVVLAAFTEVLLAPGLDQEIYWAAVRALENAGTRGAGYLGDILDQIYTMEPAMRWRLAGAYALCANTDPKLIDKFAALISSGDPDLALYAVRVLTAVGPQAEPVVPALLDQLASEPEPEFELAVKAALLRIAPDQDQVRQFAGEIPAQSAPTKAVAAFPGAEGRGMLASGGRGGDVYIVTNIKDRGAGSLREAVSKPNRTVVFAVSGTIELESQLRTAANITIAGQTATGDGITVGDYPTLIGGSNSIVRYIRFRLGDRRGLTSSDALNIDRNISNVILDHCSVSWGTDEVFSSYDNSNITVQYCLFGEGLNWLNHSAVGLWGPRATYHHNLIYSNKTRHPKLAYLGDIVDFNNNVIYNWRERNVYTGSQGRINFIGNYFRPGPETQSHRGTLVLPEGDDVRIYITGNVMEGNPTVTDDNWRGVTGSARRMDQPYASSPMTIHSAEEAFQIVLEHAGASLPRRDAVDARVISDVINGTGKVILRQSEVGGYPIMNSVLAPVDTDWDGMPDMWEIYNGLDPYDPEDRNLDRDDDGYTNLEEYLNAIVAGHPLGE
ncbi:MAG: hypothetical protein QM399_07595 [Bacillota bacterium]|nr:hypothetical protein [Bacillota bacterium]